MSTKLPRWIEYGAFILAFSAGCINVIGLLGVEHQSISHLSGTATLVGSAIFNQHPALFHLLVILLSFLAGAAISGLFLSGRSINAGRHYDSLLVIEGLLLLAAMFLMQKNSLIGHYLASCACGIQNALATRYSGAIVRTTHVTGIFTDLGIMLGARVRGETIDNRKMILFMLIILGFISGGAAGAMLFNHYGFIAFSAPIAICFTLALSYRLLVKNKH